MLLVVLPWCLVLLVVLPWCLVQCTSPHLTYEYMTYHTSHNTHHTTHPAVLMWPTGIGACTSFTIKGLGYYMPPGGKASSAFALTLRCPLSGSSPGSRCTCPNICDVKVVAPGELAQGYCCWLLLLRE